MARARDPFEGRDGSPDKHFRLAFYGALLLARELVPDQPLPPAYDAVLAEAGPCGSDPVRERKDWARRLAAWEDRTADPGDARPLIHLRTACGLDRVAVALWMLCGLGEEDPGLPHVSRGILRGGWREPDDRTSARRALTCLLEGGLLTEGADGSLRPAARIWSTVVSGPPAAYTPPDQLPRLSDLVLPRALTARLDGAASWLAAKDRALLVRGARSSGRRTLVGALAAGAGMGVLDAGEQIDVETAALARMLGAVALVSPEPTDGARALTLPDHVTGLAAAVRLPRRTTLETGSALTIDVPVPDEDDRVRHWEAAFAELGRPVDQPVGQREVRALAQAHRTTGGTIRRVAAGAVAEAAALGRPDVRPADVTGALRAVRPDVPVTLATRLAVSGDWDDIVVTDAVLDELRTLERRCRLRERLPAALPDTLAAGLGPGVRALFTGPSGTGKTLASRLLAASLGKDLYRLDLAGVVDKYLGETEKNLERVLEHAESLDVVLLIDEGDSLMAKRTDVQSSHDRYANLETNYLLQRFDTFEGIVVVTTNAEQHLDAAFERRMDVVVDFTAPGPTERRRLWTAHLPPNHCVEEDLIADLAARCALTGGQVRNVVLHACLLAVEEERPLVSSDLAAAVRREYGKRGALCPLRERAPDRGPARGPRPATVVGRA